MTQQQVMTQQLVIEKRLVIEQQLVEWLRQLPIMMLTLLIALQYRHHQHQLRIGSWQLIQDSYRKLYRPQQLFILEIRMILKY